MWPFKRKPKAPKLTPLQKRVSELEAEGFKDHGEMTMSDGSKVRVYAKEPNT